MPRRVLARFAVPAAGILRRVDLVDREALADFLRTLREQRDPELFGFHDAPRRTPGLRREEVAGLANISTIYYANIEQGRGAHPSAQVLAAIARGLRLDPGQTQHLFDLAKEVPPAPERPSLEPAANLLQLLTTFSVPALVLSARFDVIAQNSAATGLLEDFAASAPERRNLLRRHFLPAPEDAADAWTGSELDVFSRFATAQLRRTVARYPADEETTALVTELRAGSPRFEAEWALAHTGFRGGHTAGENSVTLGGTTVACDVMLVPERDQYVVFLTPDGLRVADVDAVS